MYGLQIKQKRELHLFRKALLIILLIIFVTAGWLWFKWYTTGNIPSYITAKALLADPSVSEADLTEEQVTSHKVEPNNPRYISIPRLDISNVRILPIDVDKNNILSSTDNINDAGWYKKSVTPGFGSGAVLINAHNSGISKNSIFANLDTMQPGDEISIQRGDRKILRYEVVTVTSMALEEVNQTGMKMMMQSADPDKEGLSLITTDGKWIPRYQQFDRRIMLRAVQVQT